MSKRILSQLEILIIDLKILLLGIELLSFIASSLCWLTNSPLLPMLVPARLSIQLIQADWLTLSI